MKSAGPAVAVLGARSSFLRNLSSARRTLDRSRTAAAVHAARKAIKRARAVLRLLRPGLGSREYARQNRRLARASRALSGVRDADVLLATLAALPATGGHRANATRALLRARLRHERQRLRRAADGEHAPVRALLNQVERSARRWTARADDAGALCRGARGLYAKGRKAYVRAADAGSDAQLHACRKQAKYLGHAIELLAEPRVALLRKSVERAQRVAHLLGDDRDLALLQDVVRAVRAEHDDAALRRLETQIRTRRRRLQARALERASKLYADKPARFAKHLRRALAT